MNDSTKIESRKPIEFKHVLSEEASKWGEINSTKAFSYTTRNWHEGVP